MFKVGEVIAGYVVEAYLGGGGAADVYRAHRDGGFEPVALKILHTDATNHARARERFLREFDIASTLRHRHIVAVYERGVADSRPVARATAMNSVEHPPAPSTLWMTMQYVDGPQATALVPSDADQPDIDVVVWVSQQIADALDYAHSQDVLHRDVKPANILLNAARTCAYLSDFGIAQLVDDVRPLARNGRFQGSIAYAAPELLAGQQLSPATDLYALACTMFEWLTGHPPYRRPTPFAITYAHLRDPIPALTSQRHWLPSGLNAVFAKALAKNQRDRYTSCVEFAEIVAHTLRGVPVPARTGERRWWQRTSR